MDILQIAKSIGIGVFEQVVPAGSTILKSVNSMLPDDMKFIGNETGVEIAERIQSLSPELQHKIKLKEFDVKIEQLRQSHDTLRVMLAQDAVTPQSTRPKIALEASRTVYVASGLYLLVFAYAVYTGDPKLVDSVVSGWILLASIVAPIVVWINAYFGTIRDESANKLAAMSGQKIGSDSTVSKALGLWKNKQK